MGQLVVVTGVSGAGKTLALQTLEDIGYFCVDNLPPSMLAQVQDYAQACRDVAVVVDTRAREPLDTAEQTLMQMKQEGLPVEVLFLDCTDEVLLRRFKETRRPHPLAEQEPNLERALQKERALLAPLRAIADCVLDTTLYHPQDLRREIRARYGTGSHPAPMRVRVVSFGFKYGVPADADLVLDVRFLRNPHYVSELKPLAGTEPAVRNYVLEDSETRQFLKETRRFLGWLLPRYLREGKAYLTVAIGCTGGRHRSVVLSEELGAWLQEQGYRVSVEHRDVAREGESHE